MTTITPEYLEREQELALENIRRTGRSDLSSQRTLHFAAQAYLAGRETITRDPRRFSSTPRPKKTKQHHDS